MSKRKAAVALNEAYGLLNNEGKPIPRSPLSHPVIAKDRKFLAWNVGSLRSLVVKKPELLTRLYAEHRPAVLGLMETKISADLEKSIEQDIRKIIDIKPQSDFRLIFNHSKTKKGYSGTLLIIDLSQTGPVSELSFECGAKAADEEGRLISCFFQNMNQSVVLCYVPNSGQNLERLKYRVDQFDEKLSTYCLYLKDSDPSRSVLLMGDLNVAVDDQDIWNLEAPHVEKQAGCTPEERSSFTTHYLDRGFRDTFKTTHPEATGWFTYWSVRAGNKPKNRGLRLDYVLSLGDFKEGLILEEYAPNGDHCVVGVVI